MILSPQHGKSYRVTELVLAQLKFISLNMRSSYPLGSYEVLKFNYICQTQTALTWILSEEGIFGTLETGKIYTQLCCLSLGSIHIQ